MTELQNSYPEGVCPDCGEPISDLAVNGSECLNCSHVFWLDEEEVNMLYMQEMGQEIKERK